VRRHGHRDIGKPCSSSLWAFAPVASPWGRRNPALTAAWSAHTMFSPAPSPSPTAAPTPAPARSDLRPPPGAAEAGRWLRIGLSGALGGASGLVALAVTMGLRGSLLAGIVCGLLASGGVAWLIANKPIIELDGARISPALGWGSAVMSLVALVLLARLTVFMVDASRPEQSIIPSSAWETRHSCLSAY
jgi:hypothetical protein